MMTGCVFDIQRFSLQDGPGLRTLVFLKGCSLHCLWCSNPESQREVPEVLYDATRCTRCGNCVRACTHGALVGEPGYPPVYWPSVCMLCGACAEACSGTARTLCGRRMSVEEVVATVMRDVPFYRRSGGGVTLGGGEPVFQPVFARALLQRLNAHGFDSAIETCGYAETQTFLSVAMAAHHVYYDLKHADSPHHVELTGVANHLIIGNLSSLLQLHPDVTVRYPLVPGCNDQAQDIDTLAELLLRLPTTPPVEMVPYHRFGEHKYRLLQRDYPLTGVATPTSPHIEDACLSLQDHGISCRALTH